ncbi:unnamed protein product, partial [Dicrocoelium dendriticum]
MWPKQRCSCAFFNKCIVRTMGFLYHPFCQNTSTMLDTPFTAVEVYVVLKNEVCLKKCHGQSCQSTRCRVAQGSRWTEVDLVAGNEVTDDQTGCRWSVSPCAWLECLQDMARSRHQLRVCCRLLIGLP